MPAKSSRDTLIRHWELLKILPTTGPGKTARALSEQLTELGFAVSKRQLERDLSLLSTVFPVECNDAGKPFGWRWAKGASIDVPGLNLADALSLEMVRDTPEPLLPRPILDVLRPTFAQARKTLDAMKANNRKASWADKVRAIPNTLKLLPPSVDDEVLHAAHSALLESKQLKVCYQSRNKAQAISLRLHPHALISQSGVQYLVATANDYCDLRLYALHRLLTAELLSTTARLVEDFNVDAYLAHQQGQFMRYAEQPIVLTARVEPWVARILEETPLAEDQQILVNESRHTLTATVADTWQLRWWILSLGPGIEVLSPTALRRQIVQDVSAAAAQYTRDSGS